MNNRDHLNSDGVRAVSRQGSVCVCMCVCVCARVYSRSTGTVDNSKPNYGTSYTIIPNNAHTYVSILRTSIVVSVRDSYCLTYAVLSFSALNITTAHAIVHHCATTCQKHPGQEDQITQVPSTLTNKSLQLGILHNRDL